MMKWKDKSGKQLTGKEFLERWKQGMQKITELQQLKITYKNNWIIIIGLIAGIVASSFAFKTLWWLIIVLVGALFNSLVAQLGTWQKIKVQEAIENTFERGFE
jgi:hypothetical protein